MRHRRPSDRPQIKKINPWGQILIPAEMRHYLNLDVNEPMYMTIKDGAIVMRKVRKS